jgi:ribonuclease HI
MLPTTGALMVIIFSDSVTAIQWVQDDKLGPGQRMAKNTVEWNNIFVGMEVEIDYQWIPSHTGVEGNKKADEQAKAATE